MSEYSEPPALPPNEVLAPWLGRLEARTLPRAKALWADVGRGAVLVETRFYVRDGQASRAALALYDLDRESRRSLRLLAARGSLDLPESEADAPEVYREVRSARQASPRSQLRPTAIDRGGFSLLRADAGSADFLLDAYGLLAPVLLSDPVQFALTLQAILGWPARVILRYQRRGRDGQVVPQVGDEFTLNEGDLHVGSPLPPGSHFRLRYRKPDGSELEVELETPLKGEE
jgi:hypothetical protein